MTRLELLLDKRTELINRLIELKTWAANNPYAKATSTIADIERELDALAIKISKLRNE